MSSLLALCDGFVRCCCCCWWHVVVDAAMCDFGVVAHWCRLLRFKYTGVNVLSLTSLVVAGAGGVV